jgi:ElaB/YqjD/DUF883 family membrane-anchored ribosome-binding protein
MNTKKELDTAADSAGAYGSATRQAPLKSVLHDGAVEIKQTLGHMAHDGKGAIGQMVHDGKSRVGHLVDEGQARMDDWKSKLGKTVRERPIQSLLIVAGIGAVLGMLLRRRNA